MARTKAEPTKLQQLQAENAKLRAENKRLKNTSVAETPAPRFTANFFRRFGSFFFVAVAVALLITANLLLWAGNTVVKPERFQTTITPIIKQQSVQVAVADYTTNALFESVDVQEVVSEALPPRAEFLAPTIASSLKSSTNSTLEKVLARPQFQDRWNTLVTGAQARFINQVKQNGSDGVIDLNDVYQQLGNSLQGTKLAFLAGHSLPKKVGSIAIVQGQNIKILNRVITHIDAWRIWSIVLFLAFGAASIYLSRNRRRGVVRLALFSVAGMFVTLVALRITREVIAGKVQAQYAEAVRDTTQIIFHPLVIQTATILAAFLVVATVAWITGMGRSALFVRSRVQLLFAGKLHGAIFGNRENAVTYWVGAHKALLEWLVVGVVAVLLLINRLTPKALLGYGVVTLVLVLIIELLGAPAATRPHAQKA